MTPTPEGGVVHTLVDVFHGTVGNSNLMFRNRQALILAKGIQFGVEDDARRWSTLSRKERTGVLSILGIPIQTREIWMLLGWAE